MTVDIFDPTWKIWDGSKRDLEESARPSNVPRPQRAGAGLHHRLAPQSTFDGTR